MKDFIQEEMLIRPCIYIAWSKTTGKAYVGQSRYGLTHRKAQHKRRSFRSDKFHQAIQKLGWDDFEWELLYIEWNNLSALALKKSLDKQEEFFIKVFNSITAGYNTAPGGRSYYLEDYSVEERLAIKKQLKLERQRKNRSLMTKEQRHLMYLKQKDHLQKVRSLDPKSFDEERNRKAKLYREANRDKIKQNRDKNREKYKQRRRERYRQEKANNSTWYLNKIKKVSEYQSQKLNKNEVALDYIEPSDISN